MKKTALLGLGLLGASAIYGQGTVNFSNGAAGLDAPIQTAALISSNLTAELLLISNGATSVITSGVKFEEGDLSGYFFGGAVSISSAASRAVVTLEVQVRDGTNIVATSDPLDIQLGGDIYPPSNLVGLRFNQEAVSPTIHAQLEADQIALSWDARFTGFHVETLNGLGGVWTILNLTPVLQNGMFVVSVPTSGGQQYFRLALLTPALREINDDGGV
jgi:hypothetical protein